MGWTFFFLVVVLKIPVIALLWLVWWSIRQEPSPDEGTAANGGGIGSPNPDQPLMHPRLPRRGPHGGISPNPPPRMRRPKRMRHVKHFQSQ
jgi:hypothetical protein